MLSVRTIKVEPQGELFEILEDDKTLPEEEVQSIAKQVGGVPCSFVASK